MKCIGYTRVSTTEQGRLGVSLDDQAERIRAYCKAFDIELVDIIREEGVSAGKALSTRPGGAELMRTIKSGKADTVIATKLDRCFRSTIDALTTTNAWDKQGIGLVLLDMGGQAIDTRSAMGRMFLTITAGFAEFERAMISERTKGGLQHKRRHHRCYGPVTYGWQRVGDRIVVNPAEMKVLERMHGLRRGGSTLRQIAETLNREGIPSKRGGKWNVSSISKLLRDGNGLYAEVAAS